MPLYRLDYIDANEKATGAVTGSNVDLHVVGRDDVLCRHMTRARELSKLAALRAECDVAITAIVGGGRMRVALIMQPNGQARRPGGTKSTDRAGDCKKDSGQACFCTACRAERRAGR